ncbi:heme ABC transporter substrate-binding protein IsdE [Lysinibacillus sp. 2017]|uniref:heme ABC transporter substrate-binding protein IsdE n=1 Tax=unclassified Lysinibacillus TaxID=2636778 RepID=UPI000D5280D9|nr:MULTISPECIES: heme ABC transporter substrate-binding protein IsdE [unclassified Lysinibacillus]AWE06476.1 heme ABC transporter substrate-binding protein IsdE [Lysinibacillus sp. 2017]TGN30595.1 heme ABC transporter substrate-binding protein IsdE [Lysinibacillus sp. S2017]
MKKWLAGLALTMAVLAGCGDDQADQNKEAKVNVEQTGQATSVEEDHRIIAGTVVIAQILDRLNLDAVAVPDTAKDLPARFDGLPDIGNAMDPDAEIIKSLNPTEVLSVSTLEYDLKDKFEKLKIPVDFVDLSGIEPMMSEITALGERYNRVEEAKALNAELQAEIDAVETTASTKDKPRVLILLGVPGSYLVATENSYAGDLVRLAGGENVMAGQDAEYLPSNTEYLYESNPDIILRLAHGMPDEVIKMFDEEFVTNDVWKHFNAVKNDKVYDLQEELFGTTAALNVPQALNQLEAIFYK